MFRNMNIKNYIKGGAFAALTIFAVACSSDDSPAPVVPTPGSTGTAVDLGLSVKTDPYLRDTDPAADNNRARV